MNRHYRIDDGRQTLVLAARNDRLPECVYWGKSLPAGEDLATLHAAHAIDVTGGMLDENPDLSLCPEATRSFPGQPGLIVRDTDGTPLLPKFCFEEATNGHNITFVPRQPHRGQASKNTAGFDTSNQLYKSANIVIVVIVTTRCLDNSVQLEGPS